MEENIDTSNKNTNTVNAYIKTLRLVEVEGPVVNVKEFHKTHSEHN